MSSSNYLKTLDALSRMRDQCKGELALPQICVVGDQTSGKSSLLQCITDVHFPVKSGICTRAPTVVQCRRADSAQCEIRGKPDAAFQEISFGDVEKAISKAQKALLPDPKGPKVSKTEITLRVSGPNMVDIQIVDLPGIIHHGDGKEATVELINSYIKSPQTLILLVSEAKQDHELISALALATKHDPHGKRTLRVLTKFDTFDSDDARHAASNLITSKLANALGPHAVVCRPEGSKDYDKESEMETFQGFANPGDRVGVMNLKGRLPDLFTTLVRTNLAGLAQAAVARAQQSKDELRKLGEHPLSDVAMIRECQRVLAPSNRVLQFAISPAFFKFQEAVHATESHITSVWIELLMVQDAFQCPFFQGETIFLRCMKEIVEWWREPAKRFQKEVRRLLEVEVSPIDESAVGVSKILRDSVTEHWAKHVGALNHIVRHDLKLDVLGV